MVCRVVALFVLIGCGAKDAEDSGTGSEGELEAPELTSFMLDPTSGPVGTVVTSTVMVAHFSLTGEDGDHDDEHHEGEDHDAELTGHVHVYMDDLMTEPVIMQTTMVGEFTLADDLAVGSHTLIARLHGADHLIIEPQVTAEVSFEVTE